METVRRYILKHVDGYPVDIRFERVKTIRAALRLDDDLFRQLMTGHFKPPNPGDYYMQPIQITYEEVNDGYAEPVSED